MSDLARYRSTYFAECADRIAEAERALDRLRVDASDLDVLDAAFRAVHSVKGGAGMFGFAEVVAFAHDFETLLDRLRDGRVAPEPHVAALCLRALDALADLVAAARARADEADAPPRRALVSFAPSRAFCESDDALLLLRELARLGPTHVEARIAPDTLEAFDPARPTLAWTVEIETTAPLDAVRAIFEFAAVDCALDVAEAEAPPPDVALRSAAAAVDRTAPAAAAPSVRVPLDRLDAVVDVLGDILVAQACLEQTIAGLGRRDDAALALGLETLNRHARALRESVMAMRAQPVGVVFARLPRLVRELAAQLGKKVRLESEGEAVEIDLTVVEHLADPLTHMIRNALDHGIETPDRRRAAGKLEEGRVRVAARQAGDRILVEVSDDGAGIDRARVRAKAVEKGLVAPDARLTEEALDELVLAPGFSTADAVTDLSGRGVGLDVVRANVERLGGRVSLRGDPGRGLVVRLALPLTLAVLDAMLVEAGGATYVLPLASVVESATAAGAEMRRLPSGGRMIRARGGQVALLDLGAALGGAQRPGGEAPDGFVVLCETAAGERIALEVDHILGRQQVVMKSIETHFERIEGVAGATLLSDGSLAVVLDVEGLARAAERVAAPAAA